jgi:hypothetical protein
MKLDALIPLAASVVGCYLILRSGYLRAVLLAPFRRRAQEVRIADITLELDFESRVIKPDRELEPHRHRAHLGS